MRVKAVMIAEEASPAPLAVTCSINLAVAMTYLTLTTLKLENIYFPDMLSGALQNVKDITPLLVRHYDHCCSCAVWSCADIEL